jgi:hypothetical protein
MAEPISEERLRNTRAWAAARVGSLSGAEVIVGAIDELLKRRAAEPTRELSASEAGSFEKAFANSPRRIDPYRPASTADVAPSTDSTALNRSGD